VINHGSSLSNWSQENRKKLEEANKKRIEETNAACRDPNRWKFPWEILGKKPQTRENDG